MRRHCGAHALFDEVQKKQRVVEDIRVDAQIVYRERPDRTPADFYANSMQMMRAGTKLGERIERYGTDSDVAKVLPPQPPYFDMPLIGNQYLLRAFEIIDEASALTSWFPHEVLKRGDV